MTVEITSMAKYTYIQDFINFKNLSLCILSKMDESVCVPRTGYKAHLSKMDESVCVPRTGYKAHLPT